jgi:argininosuccinate lyase
VREQIAVFADTCKEQRAWAEQDLSGVALVPLTGEEA